MFRSGKQNSHPRSGDRFLTDHGYAWCGDGSTRDMKVSTLLGVVAVAAAMVALIMAAPTA
jgi:hypothetical protein